MRQSGLEHSCDDVRRTTWVSETFPCNVRYSRKEFESEDDCGGFRRRCQRELCSESETVGGMDRETDSGTLFDREMGSGTLPWMLPWMDSETEFALRDSEILVAPMICVTAAIPGMVLVM